MEWRMPQPFARELRKMKLQAWEMARVVTVMDRFAAGATLRRDHKPLRDGVEELRIDVDRRTIRLYFGRVDDGLVLLCLHVHFKKKNLDKHAVDVAADRLRSYLGGAWGTDGAS